MCPGGISAACFCFEKEYVSEVKSGNSGNSGVRTLLGIVFLYHVAVRLLRPWPPSCLPQGEAAEWESKLAST
jgi:hypothetical protein